MLRYFGLIPHNSTEYNKIIQLREVFPKVIIDPSEIPAYFVIQGKILKNMNDEFSSRIRERLTLALKDQESKPDIILVMTELLKAFSSRIDTTKIRTESLAAYIPSVALLMLHQYQFDLPSVPSDTQVLADICIRAIKAGYEAQQISGLIISTDQKKKLFYIAWHMPGYLGRFSSITSTTANDLYRKIEDIKAKFPNKTSIEIESEISGNETFDIEKLQPAPNNGNQRIYTEELTTVMSNLRKNFPHAANLLSGTSSQTLIEFQKISAGFFSCFKHSKSNFLASIETLIGDKNGQLSEKHHKFVFDLLRISRGSFKDYIADAVLMIIHQYKLYDKIPKHERADHLAKYCVALICIAQFVEEKQVETSVFNRPDDVWMKRYKICLRAYFLRIMNDEAILKNKPRKTWKTLEEFEAYLGLKPGEDETVVSKDTDILDYKWRRLHYFPQLMAHTALNQKVHDLTEIKSKFFDGLGLKVEDILSLIEKFKTKLTATQAQLAIMRTLEFFPNIPNKDKITVDNVNEYILDLTMEIIWRYQLLTVIEKPEIIEDIITLSIRILDKELQVDKVFSAISFTEEFSEKEKQNLKRKLGIRLCNPEKYPRLMNRSLDETALRNFLQEDKNPDDYLFTLVPRSSLSQLTEEKLVQFLRKFPYVKGFLSNFEDLVLCEKIARALFSDDFNIPQWAFTDQDKDLLMQWFELSNRIALPQAAIADLMILLAYRYQALALLKNGSATCEKIFSTAIVVENYFSQNFLYIPMTHMDQLWHMVSSTHQQQAINTAKMQAFAIAYHSPDGLKTIARNSQALAQAYHKLLNDRIVKKFDRDFTVEELRNLRQIDSGILPDDSASQLDEDSTCTGTTILAQQVIQRKNRIILRKDLEYQKIIEHAKKSNHAQDWQEIEKLTDHIHSRLTALFIAIPALASRLHERRKTDYADTALDALKVLKDVNPEPISKLLSAGAITASQLVLDEKAMLKFSKMAENLKALDEIEIIKKELTGLVIECFSNDFIQTLSSATDKLEAYKKLSEYLSCTLEASILEQLKDRDLTTDTLHLGAILFEGLDNSKIDFKKALESWSLPSFSFI
jgi:hypothetical protein